MGIWLVDADVLARSVFRISALAETVGTLLVLAGRPNRPGQLKDPHPLRAAFRQRVAGDPIAPALLKGALLPHWIADFLTRPPEEDDRGFDDELARIRSATAVNLRADLAGDDPALDVPDLPGRVADLLAWVWAEAVEPDWPRRRRAFDSDIVARTRRLSTDGWAAALSDLRSGMSWLGGGRLQINALDYPPLDLAGSQLMFIPVTGRGWAGWDPPHRYSLAYPCSGLLADDRPRAPDSLSRLIGPARATLLTLLEAPMSTTQLVAVTGFALGSVGNHLKILTGAGLVHRRRAGRSVLYFRTPAGDVLRRAAID